MVPAEIVRHEKAIDGLFDAAASLEPELQAHFARYLCIRVAVDLELSVRVLFGAYAEARSSVEVSRYVKNQLKTVRNPDHGRILALLGSFSTEMQRQVETASTGQIADSVDSIIKNRNPITHGVETDVITGRLRPWFEDAKAFVQILRQQCL